jgi:hypothetical protein
MKGGILETTGREVELYQPRGHVNAHPQVARIASV